MSEEIRILLTVTPEMKTILDNLAKHYDSQSQMLRAAVALLHAVKEAEAKGLAPALIDANGEVRARLVGI